VTLIVVPVVYSLLRTAEPTLHLLDERMDKEEAGMHPHDAHAPAGAPNTGHV
jgi:hypothetical protein